MSLALYLYVKTTPCVSNWTVKSKLVAVAASLVSCVAVAVGEAVCVGVWVGVGLGLLDPLLHPIAEIEITKAKIIPRTAYLFSILHLI